MLVPSPLADLVQPRVPLWSYTTLRAGGCAEWFAVASCVDELADLVIRAQRANFPVTILGWGSNILPSDAGVPGLVIHNRAQEIVVRPNGEVVADTGCAFQELCLRAAQASLKGLEFAVGIPGTLGGALVSNAGAYRSNVSEHLTMLEIVVEGERKWVEPSWMGFSYRDSRLRKGDGVQAVLLRAKFELPTGDAKAIYDLARENQRQRIGKQPPSASAGSFFKNVNDHALADRLPNLPEPLKRAGVVPSGYLIEHCGLKGHRIGGAMLAVRHANFIVNIGGATANEIRQLAGYARRTVRAELGVDLEEEVLYLGDWSDYADPLEP